VKFDANATGGILNIVMKKNSKPGYNGILMGYIGTGDRYGGMANINIKDGKWNLSMMYNYNQSINITKGYTKRTQLDSGAVLGYFNQNNNTSMANIFNFGRVGVDYSIDNRNTITLNGMIVAGQFKTHDNQNYEALNNNNVKSIFGDRVNDQKAQFQNYNAQLMYRKTFPKVGKELTADINYNYTTSDNGYLFTTTTTLNPDTIYIPNDYKPGDEFRNIELSGNPQAIEECKKEIDALIANVT
jgi:hypothetical protein